ncbi:MAG: TolC family protein [Devosia sp.]
MAAAGLLAIALSGCATSSSNVHVSNVERCVPVTVAQASCLRDAETDVTIAETGKPSGDFARMIRDAVTGAPSVNAALTRWQAEEQKIEVARAALRPGAELFGETGIRGTYGIANTKANPYSYGVRVSVPVYDGQRGLNAARAQSSLAAASKLAAIDEMASSILDLVAASASVRHADAIIAIRKDQSGAASALLSAVRSEQTAGTASKVDVEQVEQQLSGIEVARRSASADRAQAVQSFAEITGAAPATIGAIKSIAGQLPKSQAEAEALAAANNPRIARILALRDAASLDKDVADAGYLPSVSFDLEASRDGDYQLPGMEETDFSALIRFSLPLPVSGSVAAQSKQKAVELRAANLEVDATRNGVFAGVDAALARLGLVRQGLAQAKSAEAKARSVLEGVKAERELGERTVFDQLSALNAYAEARIASADMAYEVVVAEHLLAAQTGRIDEIYGIGLSR